MTSKIMKKTDARFEEFWELITDNLDGLKRATKPVIQECLQEVYPELFTKAKGGKTSTGKKTVSGWNGFMAEQMKEIKKDKSVEPGDRLKMIAEMWNELGDDGKAEWCEENGYPAPKSPSSKKKSPTKKSSDEDDESPKKPKRTPKKKVTEESEGDEAEESEAPKPAPKKIIKKKEVPAAAAEPDETEEPKPAPKKTAAKKKADVDTVEKVGTPKKSPVKKSATPPAVQAPAEDK
jgi:hypothetical protein